MLEEITFKLTAEEGTPLLMHSSRASDPLDDLAKEIKKISSKKKKTEDDHETMRDLEWRAGLYFDEKVGPYIPAPNIQAMLRQTAKLTRDGRTISRGVSVKENIIRLDYDGPRTLKGLRSKKFYRDDSVGVQGKRCIRRRPRFDNWSLTVTLCYLPEIIDREKLEAIMDLAGRIEGLGDWRPGSPNGGFYGKFVAEVVA